IVAEERAQLPPGASIGVQGQVASMSGAFHDLGVGIVFAAVLVYLLMVVNFQSWTDLFIILTALGGAAVGIVLALFATRTTFSVPVIYSVLRRKRPHPKEDPELQEIPNYHGHHSSTVA